MKFWRIFAAAAVVGMLIPTSVALADDDDDDDDMGGGGLTCEVDTNKKQVFPLVMCVEMQNDTQTSFGNQFPWENSTGFFATYRNQFLYPSSTVNDVSSVACTIESIQARANSFAAGSSTTYGSFANNAASTIVITDATSDTLATTFALNPGANFFASISGTDATPITIDTTTGPNGRILHTCTTCPAGDDWTGVLDLEAGLPGGGNLLLDQTVNVSGGSGNTAWDVTSSAFGQGCSGPQRAYGSGGFANRNHLTTALGVDEAAYVWVFRGLAPPPPATVENQIAEIIRLLLTPEGLRCSFLDVIPDGTLRDDAVAFPNGADYDSIAPRVSSGGIITGEENGDSTKRAAGYQAP